MMKDPRNLLWIVPLAVLLSLPLWKHLAADFLSPERKKTPPLVPSLTNTRVLTSTEMDGVNFEQSKNGIKEWFLTASRLYSTENDSDMKLEDVNALFFGTAGENKETSIRSQKARYNTETKELILQGKVVVKNQKGYQMRTESLEYIAVEKKIRTTAAVHVKGNNIEVSGKRLLYDTVTGDFSLTGNVVCRIW
ncbi:LPS export ABC transporter periplasmic protein LptC [Thermodesulfobacteriota bacterium]